MVSLLPRASVFDGLNMIAPPLVLVAQPAGGRWLLRGDPAILGPAFGLDFPCTACRSVSAGTTHILWLGPDEWLVLSETVSASPSRALYPHALVDVGHRQAALHVAGAQAAAALNAGCPLDLDLSAFPVGMCTRTLFGKAEIVLWRVAAERFHVEAARSFIPYVVALLREAAHGVM